MVPFAYDDTDVERQLLEPTVLDTHKIGLRPWAVPVTCQNFLNSEKKIGKFSHEISDKKW